MYRFDNPFHIDAVGGIFTWSPDDAIAGNQRTDCAANVAAVNATVGGFDIGMHAKAANDGPFGFLTEQVVIKIGLLRSRFQAALVVGLHAALLAFGEFIFTQSNWLLVALYGQNLYDTRYFR